MTVIRADFTARRAIPPNALADKCGQMAHHARQVQAACDELAAAMAQLQADTARICGSIRRMA